MSISLIAKEAGVSTATVSRVLNDLPGVRTETQLQVRRAVQALNYVSPAVKRGPKARIGHRAVNGRRTGNIAIVVIGDGRHWLMLPVMAAVVSGIAREASNQNFRVMLEEMIDPETLSATIADQQVDGAIAFLSSNLGVERFPQALATVQAVVPTVWAMGGDAGVVGCDHVIPDDRAIARMAFEYLRSKGCGNVAYVTANPTWAMMRNRGHIFATLAHDARVDWSSYIVCGDPREADLFGPRTTVGDSIEAVVARFAAAGDRPTGLFCSNDATAASIQPLLIQAGIIPGRDVTIVSCDNEQVRLAGLSPKPVSIDINTEGIGRQAVRRLVARMNQPHEPAVLLKVPPFLPPVG